MNRKNIRLPNYDYSNSGSYFITVCTHNRMRVLSQISQNENDEVIVVLSNIGVEIKKCIEHICVQYSNISIDKYVIMPEHIHLLLTITDKGGHGNPPLPDVIGRFKSYTTHLYGKGLWQRSYIDRVVRNRAEYEEIWKYIDNNPIKRYEYTQVKNEFQITSVTLKGE